MLAGMPPQTGLYAALLPVVVYALLGTSPVLAVGPVAIISLMTFEALQPLASPGSAEYMALAAGLALLTGLWLLLFFLIDLGDRKSTRLNSSHVKISYAVFCL